ncbi:hypothetical protein ACR03S_00410 [Limimaricola variabilis]
MILTDFHFPEALERDLIGAAFDIYDKARSLTGAQLVPLLPEDGTAAVGVQVSLCFHENGDYASVSFELAPAPDESPATDFHAFVPFSQGYYRAKQQLLEGAHHYWVHSAAKQLLECHGRVLGKHQIDELEAMESKRRYISFRSAYGPLERNECLLAELARCEIDEREQDSSHSKIAAFEEARNFAKFREEEDADAANWWHSLASADREYLPGYPICGFPEDQKILFTYRNYLTTRSGSGARSGRVVMS